MKSTLFLLSALITVCAFPGVASAFDADNGIPPAAIPFTIHSDFPSDFQTRIKGAANHWTANAGISLTFNSSATNIVRLHGWQDFTFNDDTTVADVIDLPCDGSGCDLRVNRQKFEEDMLYAGTSTNTGTSTVTGHARHDFWGVMVHEFGHWLGLGHHLFGTCQNGGAPSLYAPSPTSEMASMCYEKGQPAIDPAVGGTGAAGVGPRRTISQDEVQGIRNIQLNYMDANSDYSDCGSIGTTTMPKYWMASNTPNRWCLNGTVALNDTDPNFPFPELYQRVRGADADGNDDGRFELTYRVRATETTAADPVRAVMFVRHVGSPATEKKCEPGVLTLNVWKTYTCVVDLTNSSALEFEYGIRVTDRVEIDYFRIRDL